MKVYPSLLIFPKFLNTLLLCNELTDQSCIGSFSNSMRKKQSSWYPWDFQGVIFHTKNLWSPSLNSFSFSVEILNSLYKFFIETYSIFIFQISVEVLNSFLFSLKYFMKFNVDGSLYTTTPKKMFKIHRNKPILSKKVN